MLGQILFITHTSLRHMSKIFCDNNISILKNGENVDIETLNGS